MSGPNIATIDAHRRTGAAVRREEAMITKDDVLEVIQAMPDDATVADILARLQALLRAEQELQRDNTQLLKWFP
jgi:hypothetical protein